MPGKFDLSEMKMRLQDYVSEISDLLTTPEEMQNYSNFCDALFRINSITNFYYTPRPDNARKKTGDGCFLVHGPVPAAWL